MFSKIKRFLIGNPLASDMIIHEKVTKLKALAVLSSDALSSVAYATEEILIPLAAFTALAGTSGANAVVWSLPIALIITTLLFIITTSYIQTIKSYPNGGGAYVVAKENLGPIAGLIAGASLLIDYTLTVSVSVAAGVENISSAFPMIHEHRVLIGIIVIFVLMILNLRGVRESATFFSMPTYFFIGTFVVMILMGAFNTITGAAIVVHPVVHEVYPYVPFILLLKAFASGCSALTGVEAISNSIPMFHEPSQKNAKVTLLWMISILGFLFIGLTLLAHSYGILPSENETVISQLAKQIFGQSFMYYIVQIFTALILLLAANTSYAGFPRLSSLMAKDRYVPRQLASLGDRLVFSNGIVGLSFAAMILIFLFSGESHHLIPLYAVGVFLSFTLSQAGMVIHHFKLKEKGWQLSSLLNTIGAFATFVVLIVIAMSKFVDGAWMIVIAIPVFVFVFLQIRRHYEFAARQLTFATDRETDDSYESHVAIIPVSGVHVGVIKAVKYAKSIATDIQACTVELDPVQTANLQKAWNEKCSDIPLVVLKSPYRSVFQPIITHIEEIKKENPKKFVTVIIPEFITRRWYHQFLHNQTAFFLYAFLRRKRGVVVTSVRYHLR